MEAELFIYKLVKMLSIYVFGC